MKTRSIINTLLTLVTLTLTLALLAAFTSTSASAADRWWDGGTVNIGTSGNGVSGGTSGNWDATLENWDQGNGLAHTNWVNANNDTAVIGNTALTANTLTLTAPVTVGGLRFNIPSYVINAGAQGFTFGAANNNITLFGNNGLTAGATITGANAGSGNVILTSVNPFVAGTLTFNGTSTSGWSGTTTINPNCTVALAVSSQVLTNTSGITLNSGGISLVNTATGSENTIDRVSDSAAIDSYGSGSIAIANTSTAGRQYTETIGSITNNNGQLSLGFTTIQNSTAPSTQTLMVGGLTNSGSASTIAINSGGSGAGSIGANSNVRINGITTATPAGEIIGPWMTGGSILAAQSDWAVYQSDGVSGRVASRATTSSAQTAWTSSSATGNYLAANANPLSSPVNNRLTADRMINTLRATYAESAAATHTINTGTDTITFTGHALSDGDVVVFRGEGALTDTRPYYVVNSVAGTSFQLSLTPGGSVLDLTSATAGFMATGLNLNGNKLGLNGFIVGTTGTAAIGGGSASTLTLPSTTSGNLYLHGAANFWIDPSIKDNGAGVLTLVKSGTFTLNLSGTNTYTGGTVINGGTIAFNTADSWVSGQDITFGGTGTISTSTTVTGGALTVNKGAVATITGNFTTSFASATGSGTLLAGVSGANTLVDLGDASGFTGNLVARLTGNHNIGGGANNQIKFTKLADTAGSSLQFFGGNSDSGQDLRMSLYGNGGQLTFDNRQVQLLPRTTSNWNVEDNTLVNDNTTLAHTWVINTDLLMASTSSTLGAGGVRYLTLAGSHTGDNAFNGLLMDGNNGSHPLGLRKNGNGKWIVSSNNTFSGSVTVSGGRLVLSGINQYTNATTVTSGGTLSVNSVSDYGVASAIGAASSGAIALGTGSSQTGTLEYTGSGHSTDRQIQIGPISAGSGNGVINNNGSGALTFTAAQFNISDPTPGGSAGSRNLTLGGSYTGGINEIQGNIVSNTAASLRDIAIIKNDASTWKLSGVNTYTKTTTINGGTLLVNGNSSAATGAVTVNTNATFGGTGTNGGVVQYQNGSQALFTVTPTAATGYSNSTYMTFTNAAFLTNVTVKVDMPAGLGNGTYVLATNYVSFTTNGTLTFATNSGSLGSGGSGVVSVSGNNLILTVSGVSANTAPVAYAMTFSVAQGGVVTIAIVNGPKTLATDTNSDPLIFTSLGVPDAVDYGVAVINPGGASLNYTNTSGSAGNTNVFSYIVSDGNGGFASNSISILIEPAIGANLISATSLLGKAYLTYLGIPGTNYVSELATNLLPPITWTPVATNTAGATNSATPGMIFFTNDIVPPTSFFRTQAQ